VSMFLVEVRLLLDRPTDWQLIRAQVAVAADRIAGRTPSIKVVEATYLPDRTTLLCVFEAPDETGLIDLLRLSGLPIVRIDRATTLDNP
jgi:hypothetical protein